MRGAGVVLGTARGTWGNVCVSDPLIAAVEEAQYALGEGPCVDTVRTKAPVLVGDLAALDGRWTEFRRAALVRGVRSAFGFPLLIRTSCIGALNLYHDRPGTMTDEQCADAVTVAHVAARMVLGWQSAAEPGSLAWQLEHVPAHRAVVHQATGMISVQAGASVADALDLLRAYAFAEDRSLGSVAADVVSGRLRLD
jgi:GAF domain-containing protein